MELSLEMNSKSDWLKTDGMKIVVDTSLVPPDLTMYMVLTY